MLKTTSEDLERPSSLEASLRIFSPSNATEFPYSVSDEQFDGFEPFETTVTASSQYINLLVVPKLILIRNPVEIRPSRRRRSPPVKISSCSNVILHL